MALAGMARWRRRLDRLDIRSKSEGAIAFCARAQISGGITQSLVALLTCYVFWDSEHAGLFVVWTIAVVALSLYRLFSSAWIVRRLKDRRALAFWGATNEVNFLAQGIAWAVLAWMPYNPAQFGYLFLVFFIPIGIVAAATHNLSALPLGLAALSYPIAISHFIGGIVLLGGPTGALLSICAIIFLAVTTIGTLMNNETLVNECRLARVNRFIAARSRSAARELRRVQSELLAANQRLETLASHDALTGLVNRRGLMHRLEQERARCARTGSTFSLLLIDLDHFKAVNDSYGHQTGDAVLVEAGRRIALGLRLPDLAARHGGEEFAVLLADTEFDNALVVAERIRSRIRETPIRVEGAPILITASIGVTAWQGEWDRIEAVMSRADQALYAAKDRGRDCVEPRQDPALMVTAATQTTG
ncbi:MAG: hypothetical protein RLY86_1780 [Pseudomonadota bacterium]|jgi:diguanylate cyclase (GGDEF)-like protein